LSGRLRVGLLAADDDVRLGRQQLIDSLPEFQVVFEASDGSVALERLPEATIDLLLVNHRLHSIDGLSLIQRLYDIGDAVPRIITTGPFASDELTIEAAKVGSLATVTMDAGAGELIDTMFRVIAKDDQLELARLSEAASRLSERGVTWSFGNRDFAALTDKQKLLIQYLGSGLTDEQANPKLRIKPETQSRMLRDVLRILNLRTRSQLALVAFQLGLVKHAG
jgi:DNA-binding NarL/FixJ family response regulator